MSNNTILRSNCENCGGILTFDPHSQSLKCENCGTIVPIEVSKNIEKHDISSINLKSSSAWNPNNIILQCKSCGSRVVGNSKTFSNVCPYCGSVNVLNQSKMTGLKPDSIIPFAFNEKDAVNIFKKNLKSKVWIPSKLKKINSDIHFSPLYVPSFSFDFNTTSTYTGKLYKYDNTDDSVVTMPNGHSVRFGNSSKMYFNVSGTVDLNHYDKIEEASAHISQYQMQSILPYNLNLATSFTEDYIKGYQLEHPNTTLNDSYNRVKNIAKQEIKNFIINKYSADGEDFLNVSTEFYNEKYCYRVLPTYNINFNYKKKNYNVIMNGQTGKIGSGLPKSKVKIFFATLIPILIIGGIILLSIF